MNSSLEKITEVWNPIYEELWNTYGGNKQR